MKLPVLIKKKECYIPTWYGWVLLGGCVLFSGFLFVTVIHKFLSENKPVRGGILVVEGWIPDYGLIEVKQIFQKNNYQHIITTGGPVETGSYLIAYHSHAEIAAATLKKLGIADSQIVSIPAGFVQKDRTWQSALAFKQWIDSTGFSVQKLDLVSVGAHSRRSALVFKKVLGSEKIKVGVISVNNMEYDQEYWYKSSAGVKTVIEELVSYLYTSIFFVFTGS